jgi:hypothetical protein
MFKEVGEVSEIKSGNKYYYVTPQDSSYEKIIMVLNKVQSAFPEAILKSYKEGKEISLKKALKRVKK